MRRLLPPFLLTLLCLALIDAAVAGLLALSARGVVPAAALERYFDYGRSVPGKLAQWEAAPETPGNLMEVAWLDDIAADSAARFAAEGPDAGPAIRVYGMSFANNIARPAAALAPEQPLDLHSGPGAPPNFTYAAFLADAGNRKPGDVAVLAVLSSSVSAMFSLSNRTASFEQPAPTTYPVFLPDGATGLTRIDPLVASLEAERALRENAAARAAWHAQLREVDPSWTRAAFAAPWLDASPFARLVRRSLATGRIEARRAAVLAGDRPVEETLRRIVRAFGQGAHAEGIVPVVMLIQGRDAADPDLLRLLGPVLAEEGIARFATAEHHSPRDPTAFVADGHYRREIDAAFGTAFRTLLQDVAALP